MALSVGIMGAGRMAQGFDRPGDHQVLSLAHAVTRTQGLSLDGFYDLDPLRAEAAEVRWSVAAGPRDRAAWLDAGWEVVCIATPDACHGRDLADVLARKPRAVVVEKPLSTDPDEAERLLDQAATSGVAVIVNYPRRFHSGVAEVAETIAAGALGDPLQATFIHSGSAAHAAVHMLDLFHGWWGREWNVRSAGVSGGTHLLTLTDGSLVLPLSVSRLDGDPYYIWEMQVSCVNGQIALTRSPEFLEIRFPAPHPLYPDFAVLTPRKTFDMEGEPLLLRLMEHVVTLAHDREQASEQARLEQVRQWFTGSVLRLLEPATEPSSGRMAS